jgi:hypothetical protein
VVYVNISLRFRFSAAVALIAAALGCPGIALSQANCPLTISPTNVGVPAAGGPFVVSVTAPSDCQWMLFNSVDWLGVVTPDRVGPELVQFTAAPNTGTSRVGFVFINGQAIVVSQAGQGASVCSFSLDPATVLNPTVGQSGQLSITAGASNCAWRVESQPRWVQIFPLAGTGSTQARYTIFPNFRPVTRSTVLNIGAQAFSVTQNGATVSEIERFVAMMYFNFFGRLPSADESLQQVRALDSGLSRTDLVMSFFNSPEFNLGGRFIAGLYVGVLNRDAEFSGWLFQRNALATGVVNPSQLVRNFVNSQEFGERFGSPTAEEFVTLMYRNILLREPASNEVAFQVAALNAGLTRVQLAENFLNSPEFRNGTGARLTAFLLYAVLLGRDASPADRELRIAQLQSGIALRTLVSQFLSTQEFILQLI